MNTKNIFQIVKNCFGMKNKLFFLMLFLGIAFFAGVGNANALCDAERETNKLKCTSSVEIVQCNANSILTESCKNAFNACAAAMNALATCLGNVPATAKPAGNTGTTPGATPVVAEFITCKNDGTTMFQRCSSTGQCNSAGVCVETSTVGTGKFSPCNAGETCKDMIPVPGKTTFTDPDGFSCTFRNACPGSQACCKPTTTTPPTTPGTPTTPGGVTPNAQSAVSSEGTTFTNPLEFKTVEQFLTGIMSIIQGVIVALALVFIVIGAVMILVSAGSSGMVEQGKKAITMALVGFAIGVGAPALLKQLSVVIGWREGASGAGLSLSEIAINVLNFLLGIAGVLALIMMVIGAIIYLTSTGDDKRTEKGKDIFKYAIIGIVLAMASMVLLRQISSFFGASGGTSSTSINGNGTIPGTGTITTGNGTIPGNGTITTGGGTIPGTGTITTDCEYSPTEDGTRCMSQAEWCQANPTTSSCGETGGTITCPTYSTPEPDWCKTGKITPGVRDSQGCQSPPYCDMSSITTGVPRGGACTDSSQCASHTDFCMGGICTFSPAAGSIPDNEPCTANTQCFSQYCDRGRCLPEGVSLPMYPGV